MNKSKSITAHASALLTCGIAAAIVLALAGNGQGQGRENDDQCRDDFCSQTAHALFAACRAEVADDSFKKKAICINISDEEERESCFEELREARREDLQLCREQRDGRLDTCQSLGEGRYDPDIDPALFDDPGNPTNPNPYFPLTIGNQWEYRGGTETNTLEVVNEKKLIQGVTCIVVRDRVFQNGDLVEDTDDWFVTARDGNVWYFGEEVKDFESFDGDNPRRPELVSIDGSFKAGRNGDKPGIIFLASPKKGNVYLEEFSLGNAEDVTEILSTTYKFGSNAELDRLVPQQLAERFCSSGNCVVTKNFSPLEPGVFARKYYAWGVGFFLEVNLETLEVLQLVDCNFDPRCANLSGP
jgi:hypothetical protein